MTETVMDVGTINTWLGYFGVYMLVGLGVLALFVIYLLPDRIRDFLKERERQQRHRKALASVGIVMKKKKKKKRKNRQAVWKDIRDWSWRIPLAWLLWALLLVIFLDDFIRDRLRKRASYQFSEFECKPEHLRHQTTTALAEVESMITDPLGVVPDKPFGHLNAGWQNDVMNRYIVLTALSLLIGAGIAWQVLSSEVVFLDLGLAALMYLLIVVWRGKA